jgi:hypothetical protein
MTAMTSDLVPDLLHATSQQRIDPEQARVAITMAFAGGTSGGLFSEALEKATFAPSTWDPSCFAKDLFLSSFVSECFRIHVVRDEPDYPHAVFDFEAKRGFYRTGFPDRIGDWTDHSHEWDDTVIEMFQ